MSIMAESNVYESMADDGLNEKLCLAACDASSAFMFIPKIERDVQEAMRNVSQGIIEEKTGMFHDEIIHDTYNNMEQPHIYYEEVLSTCEEVEVDYKPSLNSMMLPVNKMETEWEDSSQFVNSAVDSSFDETEVPMTSFHEEAETVEDSDEETIATFLTSAGQRLALYAVEDSDEVFAVAVYDESGEPPTNFQFLMKADVERLIGEGAVRTVKKPTQIKKQHFSADAPVFAQQAEAVEEEDDEVDDEVEEEVDPTVLEPQIKIDCSEPAQYQNNQYNTHKITSSDDTNLSTTEIVQETERKSSPLPDADKHPEFALVLLEEPCLAPDDIDEIEEKEEEEVATPENDNHEFIEQSTVQYILLGNDDSDSELTLADIEETLKNRKPSMKSLLKKTCRTSADYPEDSHHLNGMQSPEFIPGDLEDVDCTPRTADFTATSSPIKPYKISSYARRTTSSLICRRENHIDERPSVSSGTSLLIANADAKNSAASASSEAARIGSKVKRSRKQQLTSVNRDDSEIIIQPASFSSEDEEPTKKRGRGKRKPGRPATYKTKGGATKKVTRPRRPKRVEVIEIDVEEPDLLHRKKDIVEITIDESKEKGSSDKENEVIMVGDSEDEAQEAAASKSTTTVLKCEHCSRSFRKKRALETHSRVCPKSPDFVRRMKERSTRRSSTRSNDTAAAKKQYPCKICQEKFDVVVVLARHVRLIHSQRKKVNNRATTPETSTKIQGTSKKRRTSETTNVTPTSPRKKVKTSNRGWKSKKLHCGDCGRWFTSDALLTAHSLQHATKKSEKQSRRCPTCKKLIKSRLLYIRHMRMHSRAKQLQKKLHHTRQATGKTTAVRKRGRPRKL